MACADERWELLCTIPIEREKLFLKVRTVPVAWLLLHEKLVVLLGSLACQ